MPFDEKIQLMSMVFPFIATIIGIMASGWVITTWLRIKNGYPLDGKWGQALHPLKANETEERVRLLTTENAQLRAELGSIKDRLNNVERIVTDEGNRLAREIDQLQLTRN